MRLANESEIPPALTAIGLRISRIRLLKFGSIAVTDVATDGESPHPYSDREDLDVEFAQDEGLALIKELAAIVKAHPNVFDFVDDDEGFSPNETIIQGNRLLYGPMYSASVHLPKAQQTYQSMECREHFRLRLSGTYFATIVETDDLFNYDNSAHEFREIFRSQVESRTKWKAPLFGPCPLHSDVYVIGVVSSPTTANSERRFYVVGNSLYIAVKDADLDETVDDSFWDYLQYVQGFYELALERRALLAIDTEVENRMGDLFRAHSELSSLSFWSIGTSLKTLRILREELSHVFKLRIDFSKGSRAYRISREQFLDALLARSLFSDLRRLCTSSATLL